MLKQNKKWFLGIIFAGVLFRILTAIFNYGYFAIDDYYILYFSVPAQSSFLDSLSSSITIPGVRSMVPEYFVRIIGKIAYFSGFSDPLHQIQFIFGFLGIFSLSSLFIGYQYLVELFSPNAEETTENTKFYYLIPLTGLFLLSLHFIMPLVSTRALIESMSAPFLLLSVLSISQYWLQNNKRQLAFSVFWLAVASTFRFQAGICILGLGGLVVYKSWKEKEWSAWMYLIGAGILSFILTGLPDLFLRGALHSSLIAYVKYNLNSASNYGTSPWYAYLPALVILTIPPVFIGSYKNFPWKQTYRKLMPAIVYVFVFVLFHSLIPHKEERFLLPVLPLFLILLSPLAAYWFAQKGFAKIWRVSLFLILNFFLLFMLTFFTFQRNAIGLVRYLHQHKDITELYLYRDSLTHLPVSYAYRNPLENQEMVSDLNEKKLPKISHFSYTESKKSILAVREDYYLAGVKPAAPWQRAETFSSSPLEQIVIWLNPSKNKRRAPLIIFTCDHCGKSSKKEQL